MNQSQLLADLSQLAQIALKEDIGSGDVSAKLIPENEQATAQLRVKQDAIYCGNVWIEALKNNLSNKVQIQFKVKEGARIRGNDYVLKITGQLREILSIERTLINGIQFLSGIATTVNQYCKAISHTQCVLLDTRKTIPGWRLAQKYAVRVGGGCNHRMALYDAYMLKENHLLGDLSLSELFKLATLKNNQLPIYVEVENLVELKQAIELQPKQILLDNFLLNNIVEAVQMNKQSEKPCQLEASGNIQLSNIAEIAETGVDFISIGGLTKDIKSVDYSLKITKKNSPIS